MTFIQKIVQLKKNGATIKADFDAVVKAHREEIGSLYDEILLTKVIELEAKLKKWVDENDAENLFIELVKINSSGGDLLYLGHWSVLAKLLDKDGSVVFINDEIEEENTDLEYMLNIFNTLEHNYKTNETNSGNKNKYIVPLNDLTTLYDFFIPEKTLAKYRAEILSTELNCKENRTTENTKKV